MPSISLSKIVETTTVLGGAIGTSIATQNPLIGGAVGCALEAIKNVRAGNRRKATLWAGGSIALSYLATVDFTSTLGDLAIKTAALGAATLGYYFSNRPRSRLVEERYDPQPKAPSREKNNPAAASQSQVAPDVAPKQAPQPLEQNSAAATNVAAGIGEMPAAASQPLVFQNAALEIERPVDEQKEIYQKLLDFAFLEKQIKQYYQEELARLLQEKKKIFIDQLPKFFLSPKFTLQVEQGCALTREQKATMLKKHRGNIENLFAFTMNARSLREVVKTVIDGEPLAPSVQEKINLWLAQRERQQQDAASGASSSGAGAGEPATAVTTMTTSQKRTATKQRVQGRQTMIEAMAQMEQHAREIELLQREREVQEKEIALLREASLLQERKAEFDLRQAQALASTQGQ